MADSCAQISAELAALRAEVARLKPVDENSIINKAIAGAQSLLKPEIAGVAVVAAGAVKQADLAKGLADQAGSLANKSFFQSRSAAMVADLAKKSAAGAVSLSEIASMKAGNAFSTATKAQAESAVAKALSGSAQSAAKAATAQATLASRAAAAAQGVANAANALANSAIGKVLLLAANVLSLAGSIAGLFALYATLKIVFPRLDGHDRQLAQHDNELSKQMSLIVKNAGQIKQVEKIANEALKVGEKAYGLAEYNDLQVRKLTDRVETVNGKANKAIKEAEGATDKAKVAEGKAKVAEGKADEATAKSIAAIGVAQVSEGKAERATLKANESLRKSELAIGQATAATNVASLAAGKATAAEIEAQKAMEAASSAIKEIATLKPRVSEAQESANEAKSTARLAYNTAIEVRPIAVEANNTANTALGKIPPIDSKSNAALLQSGAALTLAQLALGKTNTINQQYLNVVPTGLNNKVNELEKGLKEQEKLNQQGLTKIDQLPKILEPTIVNSVTKALELAMPIPIAQAVENNRQTFEKIALDNQKALEPKFKQIIDKIGQTPADVLKELTPTITKLPNDIAKKLPTIEPDNAKTLEKLAQVIVGIGALKIALDNMPKNIAKSPDVQRTINNVATTANCRTAAPGGCTSNAINSGINNALNNNNGKLGDLLKGVMQAGNTALDLDTNNRVKDLQQSATTLKKVTGADDFPMILPEYLLDDFIDKPATIPNQVAYNVWLLKQIDALVGLFPIKIERVDENGQKQMLVFENIAEAIAELTGLIAQVAFDADTAVNVSTRATGEAVGAKAAALQAGSYLKAIIDYMGFQGEAVSFDVPISVTPGAVGLDGKLQESELKDFLKPSTQKAIGFKNTDPVDQRLVLQRILQSGEISRAALFRPLKPDAKQNPLTGDAIKADKAAEKKRIDDLWDAFKLRMEGHTAGTKVDIDDGARPTDGTTSP